MKNFISFNQKAFLSLSLIVLLKSTTLCAQSNLNEELSTQGQSTNSSINDLSIIDTLNQTGSFLARNNEEACQIGLSKSEFSEGVADLTFHFKPGPNQGASAASSVLVVPNISILTLQTLFESLTAHTFLLGTQGYDPKISLYFENDLRIISIEPQEKEVSLEKLNSIARGTIVMKGSKIISFSKQHFQKTWYGTAEETFNSTCRLH